MPYSAHNYCSVCETGDLPASGNEYRGFTYPYTHQHIYPSTIHSEPVRLPLRLPLSGLRLIQGKLRRRGSRRALISNSLINSPFAPLPLISFALHPEWSRRTAFAVRDLAKGIMWTVDWPQPSVFWLPCCGGVPSRLRLGPSPRRAHRRVDFCLLFSTGWALIVRAEFCLSSADPFIPCQLFPSKLLEFFFVADEFYSAVV